MALGALTALGAAAIDMYLPALPAIDRELVTGAVTAQQTLSAFFLGLAAGRRFTARSPTVLDGGRSSPSGWCFMS